MTLLITILLAIIIYILYKIYSLKFEERRDRKIKEWRKQVGIKDKN